MSEERNIEDVMKDVELLSKEPPQEKAHADNRSFIQRVLQGDIKDEDIPDFIREDWMRSVFSSAPFSYTADIFGGKAHVTFSEPDIRFRNVYRAVATVLPSSMYVALTSLSILLYLREISGEIAIKIEPPEVFLKMDMNNIDDIEATIMNEYNKLCEKVPSAIVRMFPSLWSVYSFLVSHFTDKGMPTSF